jgi:ribosomal protein S6--L-glutamate ligase/gamma-F420-2:alpha-L-glutamate ligase
MKGTPMAIEGLLVYNVALDNARYQEEIASFLTAFRRNGLRLTPVSNIKVFNLVEENPGRFAFAVFWDKDIHVARYLEDEAHIPIFNNQHTIGTCSDKALTYLALRNYNVPTPQTVILPYTFNVNLLNYFEDVKDMLGDLPYPFLIKDRFESIDDKVFLVADESKFKEVLIEAGKKSLLAQQYILPQGRRIIRASVVGGYVIAAVERTRDYDDDGKLTEDVFQIKVNRQIKKIAQSASKAVGADFAAIDMIIDRKKRIFVYSVKTNAGTMAIERATGMYISWYIARYIKKTFRARRAQYQP